MEMQRGFSRRFELTNSADCPILDAIFEDNLEHLKFSLQFDPYAVRNPVFLYYAIKLKRMEMFHLIIDSPCFDSDCLDNVGRNMLMTLATIPQNEHFGLALIDKGINVRWQDGSGFTYLHLAARAVHVDNSVLGQAAIKRGADINAITNRGETPLYMACEEGNYPFCCLLLYYGADATIPTRMGVLPVASTSKWVPPELQPQLQELLFDYTFDNCDTVVSLATLVEAMMCDTPLFTNIVENIADVTYSEKDFRHFKGNIQYFHPEHLRLFVSRFANILKEMTSDGDFLKSLIEVAWRSEDLNFKVILDIFFESEYFPQMVQASDPTDSIIASLVTVFHLELEKEKITEMACLMLSYGLGVTSSDLDVVHKHYGYCELFRILLHMDVHMMKRDSNTVASLYYDFEVGIEDVLEDPRAIDLVGFFSNAKLKEKCLSCEKEEIVARAKRVPQVPSLVELSRNAARKYIVSRYKVKNSCQFYTVLKGLQIGEINKKIIALERKLYCWI